MKNLLRIIKNYIPVSTDLEDDIRDSFKLKHYQKNKLILKEGQFCQTLYYLEEGTIRSFYYDNDRDISSWFYKGGQFFTSWYGFYTQMRSYEYLETLNNCKIYSIENHLYNELTKNFPEFVRFRMQLAEEQVAFIDYFFKGYMFLSAKEKYKKLLEQFPDIELQVNLGHIASFLGISQETLSRIRSKN